MTAHAVVVLCVDGPCAGRSFYSHAVQVGRHVHLTDARGRWQRYRIRSDAVQIATAWYANSSREEERAMTMYEAEDEPVPDDEEFEPEPTVRDGEAPDADDGDEPGVNGPTPQMGGTGWVTQAYEKEQEPEV